MEPELSKNTILVEIEGLTPRGEGFCLYEGHTTAVPGHLPGDLVEAVFAGQKLLSSRLVKPSAFRVKPDCVFYGPCGGCDLLELSEKARTEFKSDLFRRTVAAIASNVPVTMHPYIKSPETIRYRPRMRLHQSRQRRYPEAGFLPSKSSSKKYPGGVVPVTSCALLVSSLNKRLVAARRALASFPLRTAEFALLSSDREGDRPAGHIILDSSIPASTVKRDLEKIINAVGLSGISVGTTDGKVKAVTGSVQIFGLTAPGVDGGPYCSEPAVFTQGNIYQNPILSAKVLEFTHAGPGVRILEGYAGSGNFTLALASAGADVDAFESHTGAVRAVKKNILRSGFRDRISISCGDACKELMNYNVVKAGQVTLLLDPPRTGIKGIGKIASHLKPGRIVYVACDMESLLRDGRILCRSGYTPVEAVALDMYPRTHHVEGLVAFEPK